MSEIHWAFILASYLVCFGLVAALVVSIMLDHRNLQRELNRLGAGDRGRTTDGAS